MYGLLCFFAGWVWYTVYGKDHLCTINQDDMMSSIYDFVSVVYLGLSTIYS